VSAATRCQCGLWGRRAVLSLQAPARSNQLEYKAEGLSLDILKLMENPVTASEITLQPIDKYGSLLDAALIFSDIHIIPQALGLKIAIEEGREPVCLNPLASASDVDLLDFELDVQKELQHVLEAISLSRERLDGRAPLIGFCAAPWTLMSFMVQRHQARSWLYKFSAKSHSLLAKLSALIVEFLVAQVDAGAQLLLLLDGAAGELSPSLFREFELPYLADIAAKVKRRLKELQMAEEEIPLIISAQGIHSSICELAECGFDIVSLDWTMDASEVRSQIQDFHSFVCDAAKVPSVASDSPCSSFASYSSLPVALQGNLDPAALFAPYPVLEKKIRDMIDEFGDSDRYIINLGQDLCNCSDPDKIRFFLNTVKKISFGKCNPDDFYLNKSF
jgi:uroporphyrinogen decarboxylase